MRILAVGISALLFCACVSPAATPSPSPSQMPTPTASPSPTASPTATPGVYTNFVLGYRIETPAPWRRSACLSTQDQTKLPAGDGFVRVSEQDERGSDTGYPFDVVQVQLHPNPDRLTPERWLMTGVIGGTAGQTTEPATLDGHSAVLVRPAPGLVLAYLVPVADRIYMIGYQNSYNDTSNAPEMERMVKAFHLLTDQERAAAPSPTAIPARSAEIVAGALVDGFMRLDTDLLTTVMAPCMAAALDQAGGTFTPRGAFASQLRDSFASGLRVAVELPIQSDATGSFLKATWTQPGSSQRRDLYVRANGDVWSWYLTLTRQPVR